MRAFVCARCVYVSEQATIAVHFGIIHTAILQGRLIFYAKKIMNEVMIDLLIWRVITKWFNYY